MVADEYVDLEFGTGVVKITPAHDFNDFEVGLRHGLDRINVFDESGVINAAGHQYEGLDRFAARKRIVAELEEAGPAGEDRRPRHVRGRLLPLQDRGRALPVAAVVRQGRARWPSGPWTR